MVEPAVHIALAEITERLEAASASRPRRYTRFFRRPAGRSRKSAQAAEQERADVASARAAWFEAQPELDPERLVFIDGEPFRRHWSEPNGRTGSSRRWRLRGRAPRGAFSKLKALLRKAAARTRDPLRAAAKALDAVTPNE